MAFLDYDLGSGGGADDGEFLATAFPKVQSNLNIIEACSFLTITDSTADFPNSVSIIANAGDGQLLVRQGATVVGVDIVEISSVGAGASLVVSGPAGTIRSLTSADASVAISVVGDTIDLQATGVGGGESNTASNLGAGTGLFDAKSGVDLQFKSLTSSGATVTITETATEINLEAAGGTIGGGAAADVTYDPTASGMTATDVQAAIDELDAAVAAGGGASAAIDSLADLPDTATDGALLTVRGYRTAFDSAGIRTYAWRATKNKISHDGGRYIDPEHTVAPGVTGYWTAETDAATGVWELIPPGVEIKAEDYGAVGDGYLAASGTDDILPLQGWVDASNRSSESRTWKWVARSTYRITDTLLFDDIKGVHFEFGVVKTRDLSNFPEWSGAGIFYDGGPGTGPEAINAKAAVRFRTCNNLTVENLAVFQSPQSSPASINTAGVVFDSELTGQRGGHRFTNLAIGTFTWGFLGGFQGESGGLLGITAGMTHDMLESCIFEHVRIDGCKQPVRLRSGNADGTTFADASIFSYVPVVGAAVDRDMGGPSQYAVESTVGTWTFQNIMIAHILFGQEIVTVTADPATDTFTATAHGYTNGQRVGIRNAVDGVIPTGVNNQLVYYVVNAAANTFQLSQNLNGTPINFTTAGSGAIGAYRCNGTESGIKISGGNVTIDTALFEYQGASAIDYSNATGSARGLLKVDQMSCTPGVRDINDYAVKCLQPASIQSIACSGNIQLSRGGQIGSVLFGSDYGTWRIVDTLALSGHGVNVGGIYRADWGKAVKESPTATGALLWNPIINRQSHDQVDRFVLSFTRDEAAFAAAAVNTTDNLVLLVAHGYTDNDKVILTTDGTIPGGLALNQRYFLEVIDADNFAFRLSEGGARIVLTDQGSGTHTARECQDLFHVRTAAGNAYHFGARVMSLAQQISATTAGAAFDIVNLSFAQDTQDTASGAMVHTVGPLSLVDLAGIALHPAWTVEGDLKPLTGLEQITGVVLHHASTGSTEGIGTLVYTAAAQELTWAESGDTAGAAVDVTAGGLFRLLSANGNWIEVFVTSVYLSLTNRTDKITVGTTFGKRAVFSAATSGTAFSRLNLSVDYMMTKGNFHFNIPREILGQLEMNEGFGWLC